jgi:TP901 family phage tail tape measure protein
MANGLKDLVAKLRLDTTQFQKGLRGAASTLKRVGAAMTAASAGAAYAIKSQLDMADQLGEAAQKFGLSTEALSRLRYQAEMSGVEFEAMGAGILKLTKNMAAAAGGNKQAAAMFDNLGVSVTNADGSLRSAEEVFYDLSEVISKMPDGAEKTALAMQFLGKGGADLVPALNQGRSALEQFAEDAASMGLVLSKETTDAAGNFNDNLQVLANTVKGLVVQLAASLAPALEWITGQMVEATKWFRDLSPAVQSVAAQFAVVAMAAGPLVLGLGFIIGPLQTVLGVMKAIAVAALANPWVLVGAAAAAAAWLIYENWGEITAWFAAIWDSIKQTGAALWDGIKQMASDAYTWVTDSWNGVTAFFTDLLSGLPEVFSAAWGAVKARVLGWVEEFRQLGRDLMAGFTAGITAGEPAAETVIYDAMGNVAGVAADALEVKSPSRLFQRIGRFLMEGLGLGITQGAPQAEDAMQGVADGISGTGTSLASGMDDFKSAAQSAFVGFVTGAKSAKEALAGLLSSMAQTLATQGFNALFGSLFPGFADGAAFSGGRVTAFATGGVVSSPTVFPMASGVGLMGEAGPEAIMPLTRIGGKLGVQATGGGGGGAVQVTVTMDPSTGAMGAFVRDEAGRVVSQARPAIVQQSVAATGSAMSKTKSFGKQR